MTDRPETLLLAPNTGSTQKSHLLTGNLLGAASMMAWAAGFPAAEVLLDTWDPLAMVLGRFVMAMALLLPLWIIVEGTGPIRTARWGRGLLIGGIGFGGGAWTILMSQWFTDPVTVAIISAATPLVATLVAWVYVRSPLRPSFALGLVATLVGGIVATGGGVPGNLGLGALMALASAILFSWASFMTVREFPDMTVLGRTTLTLTGGLIFVAVVFAAMLALDLTAIPPNLTDPGTLGLLAVYGLLAMALSQILFIAAVERLGVAVASFHINIAPFYVMLILLGLGGSWSWPQAIGAAIVASGVVLAQR